MANRLPLTDEEGEVRELDEEDFARAVPFSALPESLRNKLSAIQNGKATFVPDEPVHLSHAVIERFRATGTGWQERMEAVLQDWLKTHSPG